MADFDFDELDRAVTGALGGDDSKAQTATPPVEESTPAVRRSSGRFMDVVHPSSDMRTADPRIPRAATTPALTPPEQPVVPVSESVSIENTVVNENDLGDNSQPLESPFLPDAKVEKRPLGGAIPSNADFDALELLEAPDDPRLEADTMPDPIDFAEQNKENSVNEVSPSPEVEPIVRQVQEIPAEPVKEIPEESYSAAYGQGSFQVETQDEVPIGSTSIQPQYQEQPSSTPIGNTTMYDTEAFEQPVAMAPKKKSGAWVVLWIVLLVALGGGAGAAIYFYVLPML